MHRPMHGFCYPPSPAMHCSLKCSDQCVVQASQHQTFSVYTQMISVSLTFCSCYCVLSRTVFAVRANGNVAVNVAPYLSVGESPIVHLLFAYIQSIRTPLADRESRFECLLTDVGLFSRSVWVHAFPHAAWLFHEGSMNLIPKSVK